jgi:hypothetical protein
MRLSLVAVMCLFACTVFAIDFEVSQKGEFLVLRKEGTGGVHLSTYAIRMSHISTATLERVGSQYIIVITTSLTLPDATTPVLMQYKVEGDDRSLMEKTFNQVLDLLSQKSS